MIAHTPGPWHAEINGTEYRIEGHGNPSGTVAVVAARPSLTAQADARLIAAAPALFAFIQQWATADSARGSEQCPSCGRFPYAGHREDCQVIALMQQVEGR